MPTPVREMPGTLRHNFMSVRFSPTMLRYINQHLNDKFGEEADFKGFRAAIESLCDRWKAHFVAMIESPDDPVHAGGEPFDPGCNWVIVSWIDPVDGRMYTQEKCYGPDGEVMSEKEKICSAPIGNIAPPNDTYLHAPPFEGNPAKIKSDKQFRDGKGKKPDHPGQNDPGA